MLSSVFTYFSPFIIQNQLYHFFYKFTLFFCYSVFFGGVYGNFYYGAYILNSSGIRNFYHPKQNAIYYPVYVHFQWNTNTLYRSGKQNFLRESEKKYILCSPLLSWRRKGKGYFQLIYLKSAHNSR